MHTLTKNPLGPKTMSSPLITPDLIQINGGHILAQHRTHVHNMYLATIRFDSMKENVHDAQIDMFTERTDRKVRTKIRADELR